MVGRGHRLLGWSLDRGHQVPVVPVVVGLLMVVVQLVMVVMVSGRVAGRGSVVQLGVQLQRSRYHGRLTSAAVVTTSVLVVTAVRLTADGHHVVRRPGGRVRRRRVRGPGPGRRGRVQV